ncbi:MAG: hypothetical protein KF753_18340 [Caldilineaceae bacterium]|nr:hypothetical protein [Caldilineaceae bacterium]
MNNSNGSQAPEEEDGDRLFVKIPNNQDGPSLEALGLTLNESARGLVDDLYNRLTENERLTPEKWEFYNVWNALPGKYRYETETVVTNWAYTMLEVGAALAFQIAANPLLMLQAGSRHKI